MTDIDRRTLIGVAGTSLLLTGCKLGGPDKSEDDQIGKQEDSFPCEGLGSGAGEHKLWGDSVNRPRPTGVPSSRSHKPGYVCAAYIRFEPDGIIVRQGHVRLTGTAVDDVTEQNQKAVLLLKTLKDPTQPQITLDYSGSNFKDFSMNGQQVMVLFVDNPPSLIRFVSKDDMPSGSSANEYKEHIVRFTKFSGVELGKEMEKNRAFSNIQPIDLTGQGLDGLTAYRLDFWNRDIAGEFTGDRQPKKDEKGTHRRYSMNIHLKMIAKLPGDDGKKVTFPLVFDPDTGNMGSNP